MTPDRTAFRRPTPAMRPVLPASANPLKVLLASLFFAGVLLASGAGPLAAQDAPPFPTEPPPPLAERPIAFPPYEETTLANGLRVVALPYGTQPVMSARLYLPGGNSADPRGREGLAELTATVLTRGTENRSAEEISEAIEGVGGSLSASAGSDFVTLSVTTLADDAERGFELLGDVVLRATFPPQEIELARTQFLSGLQAQQGQPQAIARRHLAEALYGREHPYGIDATPASVRELTRDEVIAFRDRVVRPEGGLLLVAGALSLDEAQALAERHLGEWEGRGVPLAAHPSPPEVTSTRIRLVHRPGSVQSVIATGRTTTTPDDPALVSLQVLNHLFGGGPDSRLNRILREERGWTYGAFSELSRPPGTGSLRVVTEVRTEVTDSALAEILQQKERLRSEPVPAAELEAAHGFLAGSFPLRLETPSQVAGQLAGNLLLGLPIEELTRFPERIRAVDGDAVAAVAREHVDAGRSAVVVVGDARQILDGLEAIAPVDLVDIEGDPIDRAELAPQPPTRWDPSRLEPEVRRYEVFVQDQPMGTAEYRLEREGNVWRSTQTVVSPAGAQETVLYFSATDFAPLGIEQEAPAGPGQNIQVQLAVEDGQLRGTVALPAALGGSREVDEALEAGVLLPGMDEYALQVADLSEGARLRIPYMDLVQGTTTHLEARVTGREEVRVAAGTFDAWRVELTGGQVPMVLHLRADSPHILVRQEYQGQPVRFELTSHSTP